MNTSWLDQHRHIVFVILLLIASIGAVIFYLHQFASEPVVVVPVASVTVTVEPPTPSPTPPPVRVYVSGAVVKSDVYVLPHGSIVKDAILAAGGFAADANRERINQALELKDQQQVHVPRLGEETSQPLIQGGIDERTSSVDNLDLATVSVININTATPDQLDSLPGIGPAIAQRIIEYRESVGGFKSIDQITEVNGIGTALFNKIKDLITVE